MWGSMVAAIGAGIVWFGYKKASGKAVAFGTGTTGLGAAVAAW